MKQFFKKAQIFWRTKFNLQQKIMYIVLITISAVVAVSLSAYFASLQFTNALLYDSMRTNLANVTTNMENAFLTAEHTSYTLIADNQIQSVLYTVTQDDNYVNIKTAISEIDSALYSYYNQLEYYDVSYMMVQTDFYLAQNNYLASMQISDEMIAELCQLAYDAKGQARFITTYSQTNGIYLVRSIRQIQDLSLNDLAAVIICIDLESMVTRLSTSQLGDIAVEYSIYEDETCLYESSENLPLLNEYFERTDNSYIITTINGERYFITHTHAESLDWEMYAYAPYNSVYQPIIFARTVVICMGIVAMILGIAIALRPTRALGKQVEALTCKMELFGKTQEILPTTLPLTAHANDEFIKIDRHFNEMAESIQTLIVENYTAELLRQDAQMKQLRAQINPHFLYNTLDSINWRAKAIQENTISTMVEALADLLRASLNTGENYTLQKEIHLLAQYLKIQQIRYGEVLRFSFDIPTELEQTPFPSMTLQPLAENAIRYAIEQWNEECDITIRARIQQENLVVTVYNTGSQFEDDLLSKLTAGQMQPKGLGIGLLNIQQRLQLKYGEQYGLSLYNENDETACVRITLPYQAVR